MNLDEFFALCKSQAQKLGAQWTCDRGLVRAYTPVDDGVNCFCPISMATGDASDTIRPVAAAVDKLHMDGRLAADIAGAADGYGVFLDLRKRMLVEFGLVATPQITEITT